MEIERTTLFISAAAVEGMLWKLRKDAYHSGLEGAVGYPLDVAAEITAMEAITGRKLLPIGHKAVVDIADLLNQEYEAGCRERVTYAADNIWMNGEG